MQVQAVVVTVLRQTARLRPDAGFQVNVLAIHPGSLAPPARDCNRETDEVAMHVLQPLDLAYHFPETSRLPELEVL